MSLYGELFNRIQALKSKVLDTTANLHTIYEDTSNSLLELRMLADTTTNRELLNAIEQVAKTIHSIDEAKDFSISAQLAIEDYLQSIGA